MAKIILCDYLKAEEIALEHNVWAEPLGEYLKGHISQKAWNLWLEEQTRLINENRLALYKSKDRDFLTEKLKEFFKISHC